MNENNSFDLLNFTKELSEKTKNGEIAWKTVNRTDYMKILDRPIVDATFKESYYSDHPKGRIVVGKYQQRVYNEHEDFFYEDHFFLTLTNETYNGVTSFLPEDNEFGFGYTFTVSLSKLYRLIQLDVNDIKNKINGWFN